MEVVDDIPRNSPCPCGSGKRFKHCHGRLGQRGTSIGREALRIDQQGLGQPIFSIEDEEGRRFVMIGDEVHSSTKWRTFIDFLSEFLRMRLGAGWGEAEFAKPTEDQHIIVQWYNMLLDQAATSPLDENGLRTSVLNGISASFYGLAYNLYLLNHNVELQERYLSRLRDRVQFQGAYYELIVANCLIRAGFELTLEDEDDRNSSHCEFTAVSKKTGKTFWVECKTRTVRGVLGAGGGHSDGVSSDDPDCTGKMIRHITRARRKATTLPRMIFVDLNTPSTVENGEPSWVRAAHTKLMRLEQRQLPNDDPAYIFVTNFPFHWYGEQITKGPELFAFGLRLGDFGKLDRRLTLSEFHQQREEHSDALSILASGRSYLQFPQTFDGRLPSEVFDNVQLPRIGERFSVVNQSGERIDGLVTTATITAEGQFLAFIHKDNGENEVISRQLTESELADFKTHGGLVYSDKKSTGRINTPLEMFDFLLNSYKDTPLDTLRGLLGITDVKEFMHFTQKDLLVLYAETLTAQLSERTENPP